jgi:hypothetical protein
MDMKCPVCGKPIISKLGEMKGEKRRWITLRRWNDAEMDYERIRTWQSLDEPEIVADPPLLYVVSEWVG